MADTVSSSTTSSTAPTSLPASTDSRSAPPLVISNITNLVHVRLDGSTYRTWSNLFKPILNGQRLMGHVTGDDPAPPASSPSFVSWYEKDQMILSWFNATLSPSALPYTIEAQTSKEAWDTLARRFGATSPTML